MTMKKEIILRPLKLVMLSGGLDSTYILWHYLTKTKFDIHVHHIEIRNTHSERWKYEREAVKNIVKFCKENFRKFTYSESGFDFFGFPNVNWDVDVAGFIGTMVARNLTILDKDGKLVERPISICIGACKDDGYNNHRKLGILDGIIRNATLMEFTTTPRAERIAYNISKKKMLEELPRALSELTWSCRKPISSRPCGKCPTCKTINKAKEELGWIQKKSIKKS